MSETDKECKKCGLELENRQYSEVTEDREIVVVDEQIQQAIILDKGDCLCERCGRAVTYYRRIKE